MKLGHLHNTTKPLDTLALSSRAPTVTTESPIMSEKRPGNRRTSQLAAVRTTLCTPMSKEITLASGTPRSHSNAECPAFMPICHAKPITVHHRASPQGYLAYRARFHTERNIKVASEARWTVDHPALVGVQWPPQRDQIVPLSTANLGYPYTIPLRPPARPGTVNPRT